MKGVKVWVVVADALCLSFRVCVQDHRAVGSPDALLLVVVRDDTDYAGLPFAPTRRLHGPFMHGGWNAFGVIQDLKAGLCVIFKQLVSACQCVLDELVVLLQHAVDVLNTLAGYLVVLRSTQIGLFVSHEVQLRKRWNYTGWRFRSGRAVPVDAALDPNHTGFSSFRVVHFGGSEGEHVVQNAPVLVQLFAPLGLRVHFVQLAR